MIGKLIISIKEREVRAGVKTKRKAKNNKIQAIEKIKKVTLTMRTQLKINLLSKTFGNSQTLS